jgi:hypothetical protein
MEKAYNAAAKLARAMIARESPEDAARLDSAQVVIVEGCYDHGEAIFDLCKIRYSKIPTASVAGAALQPDQILYVNCPGEIPERGLEKVRSFVNEGGLLVTTDWALKHVVEKAFPGFVKYGGRASADDVVRVVFEPVQDTFLEGLLDPKDDPLWWLEGSSYPIEVLDKDRVKVLVTSKEMEDRYGHSPIVIAFEFGQGKVYHMTSHFYLQRTETRSSRHVAKGTAYAAEKAVALDAFSASEREALEQSNLSEVQAAYGSARCLSNVVIEQARRSEKRKK